MFLFFLARNKLEKSPRNKPKVYFDAQLPTKELATIITSFLPIGFSPQRSFMAQKFVCAIRVQHNKR